MGYLPDITTDAEALADSLLPGFLASTPPTAIWADDFYVLYGDTTWGGNNGEHITIILAYWFLHNYVISANASGNSGISLGTYLPQSLNVPGELVVNFKHPENLDVFSTYLYQSIWGNKLLIYIRKYYMSNLASCV